MLIGVNVVQVCDAPISWGSAALHKGMIIVVT